MIHVLTHRRVRVNVAVIVSWYNKPRSGSD